MIDALGLGFLHARMCRAEREVAMLLGEGDGLDLRFVGGVAVLSLRIWGVNPLGHRPSVPALVWQLVQVQKNHRRRHPGHREILPLAVATFDICPQDVC
jgi:hypothetical protein